MAYLCAQMKHNGRGGVEALASDEEEPRSSIDFSSSKGGGWDKKLKILHVMLIYRLIR